MTATARATAKPTAPAPGTNNAAAAARRATRKQTAQTTKDDPATPALTTDGRCFRDLRAVHGQKGDFAQSTQETYHPSTETSERVCLVGTLDEAVPKPSKPDAGWPAYARAPIASQVAQRATSEVNAASPAATGVTKHPSERQRCPASRALVPVGNQTPTEAHRFWYRAGI